MPAGGAKGPEDELEACNRGLTADAADKTKAYLVGLPDCDIADNAALVALIRKGETVAETATTSRRGRRAELVQLAHHLCEAVVALEKLARKIHGNDASLLGKYGLKPLGAIRPRNGRGRKGT